MFGGGKFNRALSLTSEVEARFPDSTGKTLLSYDTFVSYKNPTEI
jgi:hypothetical protein